MLDSGEQFVVRAISTGAFRRHGVEAADGVLEQAVDATTRVGALFPGSGVADFRRIQQAGAVASATELADDGLATTRGTTGCRSSRASRCAFFTLNTNFAHRLEPFGDFIVGRSLRLTKVNVC